MLTKHRIEAWNLYNSHERLVGGSRSLNETQIFVFPQNDISMGAENMPIRWENETGDGEQLTTENFAFYVASCCESPNIAVDRFSSISPIKGGLKLNGDSLARVKPQYQDHLCSQERESNTSRYPISSQILKLANADNFSSLRYEVSESRVY